MYLLGIVFADYDHQHFARCLAIPSDSIECRYASVDFVDDTSGYLIVFFRNNQYLYRLPDARQDQIYRIWEYSHCNIAIYDSTEVEIDEKRSPYYKQIGVEINLTWRNIFVFRHNHSNYIRTSRTASVTERYGNTKTRYYTAYDSTNQFVAILKRVGDDSRLG